MAGKQATLHLMNSTTLDPSIAQEAVSPASMHRKKEEGSRFWVLADGGQFHPALPLPEEHVP